MKWRFIWTGVVLLGVAFGLWWGHGGQYWLAVHTGTCPQSGSCTTGTGAYYGFWSGFGSDIGEYAIIVGLFGHLALFWRQHTCHATWWCWRHPHHQVGDSPYYVCAHHHPLDVPTVKEAMQQVREAAMADAS